MQILLLAILICQPPQVPRVEQAPPIEELLPLPQAHPPMPVVEKIRPVQYPYVLFVGQSPVKVGNYQSIRDDKAYDRSGVYFVMSDRSYRIIADDVLGECRRLESGPVARPFFGKSLSSLGKTADASGVYLAVSEQEALKSVWPKSVPVPQGLSFYVPTRLVQRSAVTDTPQEGRYNELTVGWLGRQSQSPYDVPGGLEGISRGEWSAFPATIKGKEVKYFNKIDPFSGAFGGRLRRIDRSFEGGSVFYDLLVNARGKPFELRAMSFDGDVPEPMVLFADHSEAPVGYNRVRSKDCLSCHQDAGSVRYASGNVVGGGYNFSFPY